MTSPQLQGMAMAALGVLILSPDTLLLRVIEADAFTIAFWRNLLVATNILVLYAVAEGPGWFGKLRHLGPAGLLAALLFSVNQIGFVFAVANTGVANVLMIVATAPLFAALFSRIFLREATDRRTWLAILGAFAGMAVIFGGEAGLLGVEGAGGAVGPNPLLGNLCALAVAVALGGAFTVVRHRREVTSLPSMVLAGYFSAFLMAWFASPFAMDSVSFGWQVAMGLMVACAFALITTAPRFAPSPVVSLMLLLEAVLGPLIVWAFLAEVPSRWALLGGALVFTALLGQGLGEVLAQRRRRRDRLQGAMKSADSPLGYQAGE
ncbi:MAG: DMT family transporter [Kiloniellales bacterium]